MLVGRKCGASRSSTAFATRALGLADSDLGARVLVSALETHRASPTAFTNRSHTDASVCDRFVKAVGEARWVSSADTRTRAPRSESASPSARVAKAVDDLDAPHLRPTSIRKRLDQGVDASCHSLVALLANVVTRDR